MSFISQIVKRHEKLFQNSLFTQKVTGLTILFAIILGSISIYMNFQVRHINWEIWEKNKSEFFFEDTPLFTTMDAGLWLGVAGYLKKGKTMGDFQSIRSYPKNLNKINEKLTINDQLIKPDILFKKHE